jgi:hypothetical protein
MLAFSGRYFFRNSKVLCSIVTIFIITFILVPICGIAQLNVGNLLTKDKYLELPYNNTDNVIYVEAIMKAGKHLFLMDTGAPFFISDSLQRLYNFPVVYDAKLNDASGLLL